MSGPAIREARPADAAAVAAIWNPLIRDTAVTFTTVEKTPEALADAIARSAAEGRAFLVTEEGGEMLGFATYFRFRDGPGYARTMEHSVILAPGARGRGLGRVLMAALEDRARAAGVHALVAAVSGENPAAVAFHEALGYRRVAHLPEAGRKFGRRMDLILLQKLL